MKIDLPPDFKLMVLPVMILVTLVVLSLTLGNFGFSKFSALENQVADTQKEILVLEQKNEILSQVSQIVTQNASAFSYALPSNDSTTMAISQIKNQALASGVIINTISSRIEIKPLGGFSQSNITLSLKGTAPIIINYLDSLAKVSPIIVIKNVSLATDLTADHAADVSLGVYWAKFPETLPASSEPLVELSPSELTMISRISALTPPTFVTLSPESPSNQRSNPF